MIRVAASSPIKKLIGAEIIKWYQGGTSFSHVLIIKDDMVYQSTHKGAHTELLSDFLKINKIVWEMEVSEDAIDWEFINKAVKEDTPYGYAQILAIAIRKIFKVIFRSDENKYLICSEFVGRALKLDWVDDFTDPEDIVKYLERG